MSNLVKYSFRIFSLTVALSVAAGAVYPGYSPYITVPAAVAPFIVFEVFLPAKISSGRYAGVILEALSVVLAMLFLNSHIFSVFIIPVFFYALCSLRAFKAAVILAGMFVLCLAGLLVAGRDLSGLVAFFPASLLSIILFKVKRDSESELRAEIDAQQAQIDGKNKLLSTLSHELRTPLAVIKTSTEILLEERPGPLNKIQTRFLSAIGDNTLRMTGLVDSILASIKVEYAWFRMKKKERDIRSVIKKVCNDLQPFILSRNQTIKYSYPNLLSKAVFDDNWIQQVLINLIHNASKHVGDSGRILISANENEQCVVVSVSDDGSGIINDDKSKIFSEFYQGRKVDGGSEDKFDGVGLGLSIVKNVIEKHGGDVYVGSVPGMGTTLSFTLPKAGE